MESYIIQDLYYDNYEKLYTLSGNYGAKLFCRCTVEDRRVLQDEYDEWWKKVGYRRLNTRT
jgi:hypothetical protein